MVDLHFLRCVGVLLLIKLKGSRDTFRTFFFHLFRLNLAPAQQANPHPQHRFTTPSVSLRGPGLPAASVYPYQPSSLVTIQRCALPARAAQTGTGGEDNSEDELDLDHDSGVSRSLRL